MLVRRANESIIPLGAVGVAETDLDVFGVTYKGIPLDVKGWVVDFHHYPHPNRKKWICAQGTIIPINDPDVDVNSTIGVDNPVKKANPKVTEEVK